ncbi:hypothetical protein PFICI_03923 [Pestalotiopsis fici W106-1]|uniref:Uncharacterized protein n=1 Tax=Pestalotiopsis fici (strain W106-1 / CGMCC3.15140) TaxID=1229662 RepID=W3XIJ9_PESFW|nr:uncharacterized protein PFICI_03923 [Pestalotiopsis fici W106-1]ETS85898.1 hypothetical protein PFICI_03923 [Pestalotiopsis fici W106-1]
MQLLRFAALLPLASAAAVATSQLDNLDTLAKRSNFITVKYSIDNDNCYVVLDACGCSTNVVVGSGYCKNLSGDIAKSPCGGDLTLGDNGSTWTFDYITSDNNCAVGCDLAKQNDAGCSA